MPHKPIPPTSAGLFVLLILIAPAVADPLVAVVDDEPNDTTATAVPTLLVDLGTAIVSGGEIGNGPLVAADRDLFSFDVTAEADLPVLLTAAFDAFDGSYDGYARLFNSAGEELLSDDDTAHPDDLNPLLQTYIVEPGTYYVGVSHAMNPGYDSTDETTGREADIGGYDLAIILSPVIPPDGSLEHPESTEIESFPAVFSNQFIGDGDEPQHDVDSFSFLAPSAGIVTVEVVPTQLGLLDPVMQSRGIPAHASPRRDNRTAALELAVFEGEYFFVSVKGTRGTFSSTGFYDLHIDYAPVESGGGPFEPNDSLLQATQTGLSGPGSADFAAVIGDGVFGSLRGDVDFYELTFDVGELLEVDVTPTEGETLLVPAVHLYDYLGGHLGMWIADESGSVHLSFQRGCRDIGAWPDEGAREFVVAVMGAQDRITMDPLVPNPDPGAQEHALRAIDGGPGSVGGYAATFTISSDPRPSCINEPDNTIAEATGPVVVDEGEYTCVGGVLGDADCPSPWFDVDFYRVSVAAPPVDIDIRMTTCMTQEFDLANALIRLFDSDGNELALASEEEFPSPKNPWLLGGFLRYTLDQPGDYFVGVSNSIGEYDPFEACSGQDPVDCEDCQYELVIRLVPRHRGQGGGSPADSQLLGETGRLFATLLDSAADTIVELDPQTGGIISELDPPEAPFGGGEGLAFDNTDLFFMGNSARYPYLYRLDANTGEVIDSMLTWFGSGMYGDMVALGEKLYVTDPLDDAIYVLSTGLDGVAERLEIGLTNGVKLFGPVAGAVLPERLFASDAYDPSIVHEIDAETGVVLSSFAAGHECACDADFDKDGDVDDQDEVFFDNCDAVSGVSFGCASADLNCDADINEDDRAIFDCQQNGAGNPPNPDCCPEELPSVAARATGLAGVGRNVLVGSDWTQPALNHFDPRGDALGTVPLDAPVGQMAGVPLMVFADWDFDGDVDLIDWAMFQACFTGEGITPYSPGCQVFDFEFDLDVDLFDYAEFQAAFTGVTP